MIIDIGPNLLSVIEGAFAFLVILAVFWAVTR